MKEGKKEDNLCDQRRRGGQEGWGWGWGGRDGGREGGG